MAPPRTRIGRLVAALRRLRSYRARRERSVANIARANSLQAYEEVFGSPDLLREYLGPERRQFYAEVAAVVAGLSPRRLLDAGCGTGHLLATVLERSSTPEHVVGVDQTAAGIAELTRQVPFAEGIVGDVFALPFGDGSFDVVLCTEVLEHVRGPEALLLELVRVCDPGGTLVLTVPDGDRDDYEGHLNFWNEREFGEFVGAAGKSAIQRTSEGDLVAIVTLRERAPG